jgi:rhodanese-related sulfurtransferase
MSSYVSISSDKLSKLIGTGNAPTIIDVRIDEDFAADPRLIPGAARRAHPEVQDWASQLTGQSVVVVCQKGQKLSEGTAAWLRHTSVAAEVLEGGHVGWREADLPTVPAGKIPARDGRGRTVWVTRSRPKIDRIACPWLIRRFIDPSAVFLFVAAAEVQAVSERFNATPFDVENVFWSHRGELCTFDGGGIRARDPAVAAIGNDGACRRYRATRSFAGGARSTRCVPRAFADVRR